MKPDRRQDGFALSFRATAAEARAGLCAMSERLGRCGLPRSRLGDVEIAVTEAVNNVVEHGFPGRPAGRIRIGCRLAAGRLEIRICDDGAPMPGGRVPPGVPADLPPRRGDLPEGGFGWFLIRQLASDIRYYRENGTNRLLLGFGPAGNAERAPPGCG